MPLELPVLQDLRMSLPAPDVGDAVAAAALLSDPTRASIVRMLRDGPVCVCELAAALDVRQNNVSNHLDPASRRWPRAGEPHRGRTPDGCTTNATTRRVVGRSPRCARCSSDPSPSGVSASRSGRRVPGGRRVAHRLVRRRPVCRPGSPTTCSAWSRARTSVTRSRSLPLRRPEGAPAPARDRHRRHAHPRLLPAREGPDHPRRSRGVRGDRRGGRSRDRHPVLLLLGSAAVHRLRRGRRPARGDVRVPDQLTDGQRGRPRPVVGPVRTRRRARLHGGGADGRHPRRAPDREAPHGALRRGLRVGAPGHRRRGDRDRADLEERVRDAWTYTKDLVRRIFPYVLVGIGIGAFIHGFVPTELVVAIGGPGNPSPCRWWS